MKTFTTEIGNKKKGRIESMFSQDQLKSIFEYDNGNLIWKRRAANGRYDTQFNTRFSGKIAGGFDAYGYLKVAINKGQYFVHKIIFFMINGQDPEVLDHIDGDRTNNRIENLRVANYKINNRNRGMSRNNTSGYTNIRVVKTGFHVRVRVSSGTIHLGVFSDIESAIAARDNCKKQDGYTKRAGH